MKKFQRDLNGFEVCSVNSGHYGMDDRLAVWPYSEEIRSKREEAREKSVRRRTFLDFGSSWNLDFGILDLLGSWLVRFKIDMLRYYDRLKKHYIR